MENNPLSSRRGFDISVLSLLVSNIFTIYYAFIHNLSVMEVMFVYLVQTLIIGIMNVPRILYLGEVSTKGYVGSVPLSAGIQAIRQRKALIFALHFGVFLATYTMYLIPDITISLLKAVAIPSLIFFVNHLFSFFYNKKSDLQKQSIGVLMFLPYMRLLPMHIVLLTAQATGSLAILFLFLKTGVDIVSHIVEHAFLKGKEEPLPL